MFSSKRKIIEKQSKEIKRLNDALHQIAMEEITISQFIAQNNQIHLQIEGSIMHIFADSFLHLFKGNECANFLESTFADSENGEEYSVTMQKVSGMTPAAKINILTQLADNMSNAQNGEEYVKARQAYLEFKEITPSGSIPVGESR